MAKNSERKSLEQFNAEMADAARRLHDQMAASGHPVTPEEAKFLLVVGFAATAQMLGLDSSPLDSKLEQLASELPKVGDERAAAWRTAQGA